MLSEQVEIARYYLPRVSDIVAPNAAPVSGLPRGEPPVVFTRHGLARWPTERHDRAKGRRVLDAVAMDRRSQALWHRGTFEHEVIGRSRAGLASS